MVNQLRITHVLLATIAALLITVVALGPAAARSDAAQCKGADTPAFKMDAREARHATLCLVNKERSSHGLKALHLDGHQQEAAARHNRLMVQKSCFSHQCSGEPDIIGRLEKSGYLPCNCNWSIAENIAYGGGDTSSPRSIFDAWMGSSEHRMNIMNKSFEAVGIGIDRGSPEGDGSDAATYTMDFGYKN